LPQAPEEPSFYRPGAFPETAPLIREGALLKEAQYQ